VVLGLHPEDRDGRHVLFALGLARQLQRGQRFQQRVHRAAEDAGLLAGDDGDGGGIGEAGRGGARGGGRAAMLLLSPQHFDQPRPIARMLLRARDRVAPGRGIDRIAGVEILYFREVVRVVAGERPDPREPPHIHTRRGNASG
jgi:hypothetical protein